MNSDGYAGNTKGRIGKIIHARIDYIDKSAYYIISVIVVGVLLKSTVIALKIGGECSDRINAKVDRQGVAVLLTELKEYGLTTKGSIIGSDLPYELPVNAEQTVSGNYVRAAQLLDIDYAIGKYKGPVLIVHGDQDEAIPVHYSEEAAAKYSNARLVIIKGDDHCYNYHLDEVLAAIREFTEEVRS